MSFVNVLSIYYLEAFLQDTKPIVHFFSPDCRSAKVYTVSFKNGIIIHRCRCVLVMPRRDRCGSIHSGTGATEKRDKTFVESVSNCIAVAK